MPSRSPPWKPSSIKYTRPPNPSPNLQTVFAFIDACNEWTKTRSVERTMVLFDDTLEHRILPNSLARPVLNKKQYAEYTGGLLQRIKSYKISLHGVVESGDTIVIHTTSVGEGFNGTSFSGEEMTTFRFVPPAEQGGLPRICSVKEFVDSRSTYQFFLEERRKSEERAGGNPS
ncbi:hypothetical protein Moror_17868 [Moniliophthora roreri MCA 2997]|uniref:SnoaL-like domain-containing protein n=1 Tax=Moniliophthora roreri (strain MCA 2997) TaxID=1381753 RepID=V2XTW9_MONRO|nr:hypothetical protein Moror_17868 [Moniliophthora roreri MCA 2997]KAI3611979.1 hypothetical protein WG66_016127 [Moniliophthora roreri]